MDCEWDFERIYCGLVVFNLVFIGIVAVDRNGDRCELRNRLVGLMLVGWMVRG